MTNTTKLLDLAQLAEASYADLRLTNDLETELTRSSNGMTFSSTQATDFATHWQVISHQADTPNGFSATLFQRLDTDGSYQAG